MQIDSGRIYEIDYFKQFEDNLAYHFSEVLNCPIAKPTWIYISLSHKCTYSCQMCGVVNILKGHELSAGLVRKTLDEISQWEGDCNIIFTGGEPFLREDIFELIEHSANSRLRTEIVSNGSLIDSKLAKKIVSSQLANIAISLDGAEEATHDAIREKGSFKKAINAISALVKEKKNNGYGPQLSVWTTIMKENVKELFRIIAVVNDLGVERLIYHPVIAAQDDMQNTSSSAPFWIKGDNLEILKGEIDKIVDYQAKYGTVAFLHNPYLWLEHFKGKLTKKEWKCNPFVFLNIGPDGEVRSCGDSFGNIRNIGINACLNTQEANLAREQMKACDKPCLQTCWGHPESDSLSCIVETFIKELKKQDNVNKKEKMNQARDLLCRYQGILKKHA